MEAVFILLHIRSDDDYAASERLANRPGFTDHPNGWHIDRYMLDQDHWEDGFGPA